MTEHQHAGTEDVPTEISVRDWAHRIAAKDSDIDAFTIMACAARRSGKTWLINWLLYHLDAYEGGQYDAVFLFSGSSFNGQFTCIPKRYQYEGWTDANAEVVNEIMRRQKTIIAHNEEAGSEGDKREVPRVIILFDDIMGSEGNLWQGAKAKTLANIFYMGRHLNISTIVILQKFKGFSQVRSNSDFLIIFRAPSHVERKDIIDGHLTCTSTDPESRRACERFYESTFKSRFHCCLIDLAGSHGKRRLSDYVYSIAAPPDKPPTFGMGPEHHWQSSPD